MPAIASRTAGWLATTSAVRGVAPTVASTWPASLVTSRRLDWSCDWYSLALSCTVAGSLVSTAAFNFGVSAMSRAIIPNVWVRVARSCSTSVPVE